jgi:hypothetical protein
MRRHEPSGRRDGDLVAEAAGETRLQKTDEDVPQESVSLDGLSGSRTRPRIGLSIAVARIESQSVKSADTVTKDARGYDAGKKPILRLRGRA